MAKKLKLIGFVLQIVVFSNLVLAVDHSRIGLLPGRQEPLLPVHHKTTSRSPVNFSPISSPSPDSDGQLMVHRPSGRARRVSGQPVAPITSWWKRLPSKELFDRVLYGAALLGVGIAIGATVSTCNDMKGACSTAQGELSQCNLLFDELKRIGALVCRLDPTVCPSR